MKQIFVILLLCIHTVAWAGKVYTVETVPKLRLYNKSYISDPDHLLKEETVQRMNQQLYLLEGITTDQVAVVVLGSIGSASPKDFANRLFSRFRVGQKDKDNGLLILLVMNPHRVEFETGYGLEGVLPDATCKRIQLEYMIPRFKEGDYDQGLSDGVTAVIKILNNPDNTTTMTTQDVARKDPQASGRVIAWIMAVPYLLFMSVFYFVKQSKGAFTEDYTKLSEAKKRNVSLTIPRWRWLLLYFFVPLVFYAGMIYFYRGSYYVATLVGGAYAMILLTLVDKKSRCKKAYAASYKEGDYFNQYNQFNRYFDNWGLAAVFFPIPFLFTDAQNNKKLKAIRRHERPCGQCGTAMILLDEKKDDEYLQKSQILEESIKSVDYDVWLCPTCHSHDALGYNSKFSKYKACSYCGTKASFLQSDITKVPASYNSSGIGEKTYQCMYCKKVSTEEYTIAQLTRSSDSSSGSSSGSSSSSSSSSSSGGGSSGGGGAGSSW
ncbi:MAG: hypothetical protein JWM14_74 [Chitinophagaceae bacterium]|nr:hypothetical protein [Chitinophagaceae bacterium]